MKYNYNNHQENYLQLKKIRKSLVFVLNGIASTEIAIYWNFLGRIISFD